MTSMSRCCSSAGIPATRRQSQQVWTLLLEMLLPLIDADLQDPPELLPEMAALLEQGYDIARLNA